MMEMDNAPLDGDDLRDRPAPRFLSFPYLGQGGRLGNQLWQLAATAGIAFQRGLEPRFPPWPYQPYLNVPREFFVAVSLAESDEMAGGHYQDLHHFSAIEDEVKRWFQPAPGVMDRLFGDRVPFAAIGHTTAVHVRRGDYLHYPQHHPILPLDYYRRAAEIVRTERPDTMFVVFSDDVDWCESSSLAEALGGQSLFQRDVICRVGAPHDLPDLLLMMACNRHIIANSTYSWWAAYLSADPAPIYPSVWFGPAYEGVPWQKMLPDIWIEVDASA
jgi:hypothetical protein